MQGLGKPALTRLNHRLDTLLLQSHGFGLTLHDLRTRFQKLQSVFVSAHDAASFRAFRDAFSCSSGYVCRDAVLGRCMLAVACRGEYFVFDGVGGDAFFGNDSNEGTKWMEVIATDEGNGIIRIQSAELDDVVMRVDKDVSRLVGRVRRRVV